MNRFRVSILESQDSENPAKHHFVSEIRFPDDILLTVIDTGRGGAQPEDSLADQNLISFE